MTCVSICSCIIKVLNDITHYENISEYITNRAITKVYYTKCFVS